MPKGTNPGIKIPDMSEATPSVRTALQQIVTKLGMLAKPVFAGVAGMASWIVGTSNQIVVTDNGDDTVTLSTPQDIHTGASPTFDGLTINSGIFKVSGTKAGFLFGVSDFPSIFSNNTAGIVRSGGGSNFSMVSAGSGVANNFVCYAGAGTIDTPEATGNTQNLFRFSGRGHNGTGWIPASRASLEFQAAEQWTETSNGTKIIFSATPTGSQSMVDALTVYGDSVVCDVPLTLTDLSGVLKAETGVVSGNATFPDLEGVTFVDDEAARLALEPTSDNGDIVFQEDTGNYYFYREI